MTTILTSHRDIPIIVTSNGNFQAVMGEGDESVSLASFELANLKGQIDAHLKAQGKSRVFDLAVINHLGESAKITGIHLGTSKVITKPGLGGSAFYVDTPFTRSTIEKLMALNSEQRVIMGHLKELTVESGYGHGRMDPELVEGKHDLLADSYISATLASEQLSGAL